MAGGQLAWRAHFQAGERSHCPIQPPLHPTYDLQQVIDLALAEDAGTLGDVTTLATISASTLAEAEFLCKDTGVVAGLGVVDLVCSTVDPALRLTWAVRDGDKVVPGQKLGVITGSARSILVAERIALNFMQRMSGVASVTAAMVAAVGSTHTKVLETRKTIPGLRLLDKWAVLIGGGCNHRMGLYDMMMIKDNHIAAAGGIRAAVAKAESWIAEQQLGDTMRIEVETETLEDVDEILQVLRDTPGHHVCRVMLDNMTRNTPAGLDVSTLKVCRKYLDEHKSVCDRIGRAGVVAAEAAVERIGGQVPTEASGNVTLHTVAAIAACGVDFVSVGSLTHSVKALDISLNITLTQPAA